MINIVGKENVTDDELKRIIYIAELWLIDYVWIFNSDHVFYAQKLMFHWSLLFNTQEHGHDERWCYKGLEIICDAMNSFKVGDEYPKYWHKWHNKNICVLEDKGYLGWADPDPTRRTEQPVMVLDWSI